MGKVTSRPQILKAPEDYDAILALVKTYEPVLVVAGSEDGVILINFILSRRSGGKYSPVLLLEKEDAQIPVYDCTLRMDPEDITSLAEDIQTFCLEQKVPGPFAALTAVSSMEYNYVLGMNQTRLKARVS